MLIRRRNPMIAAGLWLALALALAPALAGSAGAQDEIAPPYVLTAGSGAGTIDVRPGTGYTTIAITVSADPAAGQVVFRPAAQSAPAQCANDATSTTCPAGLMSGRLDIDAAVVEVDVNGVDTAHLRIHGGGNTDTIAIRGPAAPADIDRLDVFTGPGADELTVRGRVVEIHDDSGAAGTPAADQSPDRYVVESPLITGELRPAGGDDIVVTDAPALALDGGDGNDTLTGPGALTGGAGNDLLKPTTAATSAAGGTGTDRVSYEMVATPLALVVDGGAVSVNGAAAVTEVEQVEGGAGNDAITGDAGANTLAGGAGDDIIEGRGASDALDGGPGSDTVSYAQEAAGVAVVLGSGTGGPAGAVDTLSSFDGVVTGAGNDIVVGSAASERFALGAGDDTLDAGDGSDSADGGAGNDTLRGGPGRDVLTGGAGSDTITYDERTSGEFVAVTLGAPGSGGTGGEGDVLSTVENVIGTPGPDSLVGDGAANVLIGGFGQDSIAGGGGDDVLFGGEHRDVMDGGPGRDGIFGEGGDDSLAAFDNEADVVDCGESPDDDAQVDPFDAVAGCEYARRLDIPIPVDNDRDGIVASFDCNDSDPGVRPGATDVPGDRIDQDCDGFDEQLPFVSSTPTLSMSRPNSKGRRVTSLRAEQLAVGTVVRVRCLAPAKQRRACAFRVKTRTSKSIRRPLSFTSYFRNRSLPARTRIEMRITTPGRIGKVWTYRINKRIGHATTIRCLTEGNARKPRICPPEER